MKDVDREPAEAVVTTVNDVRRRHTRRRRALPVLDGTARSRRAVALIK